MADHVYNTDFAIKEFLWGGEVQIMERLTKFKFNTIFDVGANIGEWAKMVRPYQPHAAIHCFEPMPSVFKTMMVNTLQTDVMPNPFGLSDQCEVRDMLFSEDNDRLTTPCLDIARVDPRVIPLLMVDGDTYCKSREIETIDFLKIDTEGHEFKVLKGFDGMLKDGKIAMIQFEYGYANVLTKDLLIDFYRYLQPYGYTLGKLTDRGAIFKDYGLQDEDFQGPNYLAVHQNSPDLIAEVQFV